MSPAIPEGMASSGWFPKIKIRQFQKTLGAYIRVEIS
jgi:hypothetical protein